MSLQSLGADPSVHQLFEPYATRGLTLARVAISHGDHYRLLTGSGELDAQVSGTLWYKSPTRAAMPVTGDWVAARIVDDHLAIIDAVLPRKSVFSRRAAGRREDEQPVAANIDLVFLVCGLDADFNLRRLERYLTLAAEAGAAPVIVLNKADLCDDIPARIAETAAVAHEAPILATTTRTPHGLDALRTFLTPNSTVALLGSSGVGKSAIINALLGEDRLRTGAVRDSDGRGCHTTTHRELVLLPDGCIVIDTPGMRELQLWASAESIAHAFDDIAALAAACRFRNCSHSGEPGCALAAAIAAGEVPPERWNSYQKLLAESRRHEELASSLAAAEKKRQTKIVHKRMRAYYRQR